MSTAPTPALPFEVIETESARIYRLPPRRVGPLRLLALAPLAMVVVLSALLAKFYFSRDALKQMGLTDEWFWAAFVFLSLGWAWMTYTSLDMTASFLCGHSEIEIAHDGMVTAYDRAGWFGFCVCWFRPGGAVRLVLEECSPPPERNGRLLRPPEALWQLSAQDRRGRKGWLAIGYPRAVLLALAEHLAPQLGVAPPAADDPTRPDGPLLDLPAPPLAVVAEPEFPNRDTPDPPPNTRVTLERHDDGVTITVPRLGLRGKNGEMFAGGLFLAVVGGLVIGVCIHALINPNGDPVFGQIMGLIVAGAFFAGGVVLLAVAYQGARERVVLAVVGDKLLTLESGPFHTQRLEFARADVLDIACVGHDHHELRIVAPDGSTFGLLERRNADELKWIATVLRQALGIPGEPPEFRPKPGAADQPWAAHRHRR